MQKIKKYLTYLFQYIIGDTLFNLLFSIMKTCIINYLGAEEKFTTNLILSFRETFLMYSAAFVILMILANVYDRTVVRKLNYKLERARERRVTNEE